MEHMIDAPARYELRVAGQLSPELADWFDGFTVTPGPEGTTVLAGIVADQSALHGALARVRDLGLTLLTVVRAPPAPAKRE